MAFGDVCGDLGAEPSGQVGFMRYDHTTAAGSHDIGDRGVIQRTQPSHVEHGCVNARRREFICGRQGFVQHGTPSDDPQVGSVAVLTSAGGSFDHSTGGHRSGLLVETAVFDQDRRIRVGDRSAGHRVRVLRRSGQANFDPRDVCEDRLDALRVLST
jgi:hypothetical protein